MKPLTFIAVVGIIATLASGQTQSPTGPSPSAGNTDEKGSGSAPSSNDVQTRTGTGPPANAAATPAGPAEASTGRPGQEAAPKRDIRAVLNGRIKEVNFDGAPFERVIDWLQDYTGILTYVRWAVLEEHGIDRETPITIKARDQKLSRILWVMMNEAAGASGVTLAYQASDDLILLSTHEDLGRSMVTRAYEVDDLIAAAPYFFMDGMEEVPEGREGIVWYTRVRRTNSDRGPAVSVDAGRTLPSGKTRPSRDNRLSESEIMLGAEGPQREIRSEDAALQEIMELILNTVEPESWAANGMGGQGTIFPYKGRLLVWNSIRVHQVLAQELKPQSKGE
jgi:hypothetical protein